jgi:VWFA-related protein
VYSRREWLALAAISALRAQDESPVFSTDVKVVSVLATVLDKQNRIVRDLKRKDFQISENGRPQTIKYFSRDTDLPLTLGLMVDTSMSQQRVMSSERVASFHFLDRVLRPKLDKAFIMQFDMAVRVPQPLTESLEKLEQALVFVDTPTRAQLREQAGGGTLLFDAVVQASKDIMAPLEGRKALIILSDGGENGSDSTLADAIGAAHLADTMVYSILFGGSEGKGILERISRETGGGFFEVTKRQTIDQVFDAIQDELRSQYDIGYVSDVPVRISEFRRIQLTADGKGLKVQARDRYWARR